MKNILNNIFKDKKAAGVRINITGENTYKIDVCLLLLTSNVVRVSDATHSVEAIDGLKTYLKPNIPISLVIDGKGLLTRKITHESNAANNLTKVIPNAKPEDFYTETNHLADNSILFSVIRKTVVDSIIKTFSENKWYITGIHLGPYVLQTLLPYLELEDTVLTLHEYQFTIAQQQITDCQRQQQVVESQATYTIGEEQVASQLLLAYTAALKKISGQDTQNESVESLEALRSEFKHRKIFHTSFKPILAFFLCALLVNTVCFLNFSSEHEQLSSQSLTNEYIMQKLAQLRKEVLSKEKFLLTMDWTANSRKVFFADRLASTVPASVKLTELSIHPLDEEIYRKEKRKVYQNNTIRVAGVCQDPVVLNRWLSSLEELDWIQAIQGRKYYYDEKQGSGVFNFLLEVK